jgi:hypothetical protein
MNCLVASARSQNKEVRVRVLRMPHAACRKEALIYECEAKRNQKGEPQRQITKVHGDM